MPCRHPGRVPQRGTKRRSGPRPALRSVARVAFRTISGCGPCQSGYRPHSVMGVLLVECLGGISQRNAPASGPARTPSSPPGGRTDVSPQRHRHRARRTDVCAPRHRHRALRTDVCAPRHHHRALPTDLRALRHHHRARRTGMRRLHPHDCAGRADVRVLSASPPALLNRRARARSSPANLMRSYAEPHHITVRPP